MKTKNLIYVLLILIFTSCFTEKKTKLNGDVNEVVKTIVIDILMLENNIDNNTNLIHDLGADELDIVEITIELEYQYDLVISDNDMENFYTVGNIVEYIENRTIN